MKSYLNLIQISAKVRRRQNRMAVLCIVFAVFLVTAIFSTADMMVRTQSGIMMERHGNWHIKLEHVPQDAIKEISGRSDITAIGASCVFNIDGDYPYRVNEKKAVLYGTEETYMREISNGIVEGTFPRNDQEVMLSPNAKLAFQVQIGDKVTLHTPAGDQVYMVSGLGADEKAYYEGQTYLVGVYMTQTAYDSLMVQNGVTDNDTVYYLQFADAAKAAKAITEIQSKYQLPEGSIAENTSVMGMAGQSKRQSMQTIYGIAAVLFVLVLMAGILMISGSLNSNIAQRTQFFGMMRCIGASRKQIIRFVRLEALHLCKMAVPAGIILGIAVSWGICAALRYGIGGEFAGTPVFEVSLTGLISGAAVGFVTVFLAAQSPAKRAAKVSPVAAVSGNAQNHPSVHHAAKLGWRRIECSLGIHHASASKKNWCLMTASFALSIILFFSFSVLMDFAKLLLPSQSSVNADLVLNGYANETVLDRGLVGQIKEIKGVSDVYGCNYTADIPVTSKRAGISQIGLVSYDDTLLECAKVSAAKGNLEEIYGNSNKAAVVYRKDNPLKVGDTIQIAGREVEVVCALSDGLFSDNQSVICSQETYDSLIGEEKYVLIGVQFGKDATEETAAQIRRFENDEIMVIDQRSSNQQDQATFIASRIVVYGFLVMIGAITLLHIINSISMSVSARVKQYGAMRAVGMDSRQVGRMIRAEAFTYAVSGLAAGLLIGIPLSRFMYLKLITGYFGVGWRLNGWMTGIVAVFVMAAAALAVHAPAKRMRNMAVTETINEL